MPWSGKILFIQNWQGRKDQRRTSAAAQLAIKVGRVAD